jgi:hypothetical protein
MRLRAVASMVIALAPLPWAPTARSEPIAQCRPAVRSSMTTVYEGRAFDRIGDTATGSDPEGHLLLVMEGNFDVSTPTPGQIESLARMVAWGSERFDVPLSEVTGHRDHAATLCPGAALQALIVDGSLVERAARLLSDGGVTLRGA